MANKENISLLSKYHMRVLYYKCKEGATHEEIAEILGRDVNTVKYHMTKIYKILEISEPSSFPFHPRPSTITFQLYWRRCRSTAAWKRQPLRVRRTFCNPPVIQK